MFKNRNWVKLNNLDKNYRIMRLSLLIYEISLSLTGFGLLLACLIIGDPYNRMMSCVGLIFVGIAPLSIELLIGRRFTFFQHIMYDSYFTLSMLIGSCLYMFELFGPMDEIMHFIFGCYGCIIVFYLIESYMKNKNFKPWFLITIMILISMGMASVWEVLEFTVDVFGNQGSLGYPPPEVIEKLQELGYTGIKASWFKLQYVSVIDTVTDMALHLAGSVFVAIFYGIYLKNGKGLFMKYIAKDANNNGMNKNTNVKEITESNEI